MPTSTGLAVFGAVILLALAKGAINSGRWALAVVIGMLALAVLAWAVYDWTFFLER